MLPRLASNFLFSWIWLKLLMFLVPLPVWWDNMTAMCHHAQYYAVLRSELKALCMRTLCVDRQLKIQGFNKMGQDQPFSWETRYGVCAECGPEEQFQLTDVGYRLSGWGNTAMTPVSLCRGQASSAPSLQRCVLVSPVLIEQCASVSCPVYGSWVGANCAYKTFL